MSQDGPILRELFSLEGEVALVTGAARGLGLVMARTLARAGATVYLNGRSGARLAAVVSTLSGEGVQVFPCAFDVTDFASAETAIDGIVRAHGRLDILVNNVGVRMRGPAEAIGADDFAALLHANLTAPFALAKLAAAAMRPRGHGRIIMLTSAVAGRGVPNDCAYTAAKGGLGALTRALACEWGAAGITCNAIAPGRFLTETNLTGAHRSPERVPLRRWGDPGEMAGACLFLASRASSYVTGVTLQVDGGLSAAL